MRVHDRLRPPLTASVSEGNRVRRADPFGHELVERDRVAERAAGRVRGRGQEADVRRVAAVHVRVRHAAEHGEVVAVFLEQLQVRRGRVVAARVLGEERLAAARRGCCRCRTSAAGPLRGGRPRERRAASIPGTAAPSPRPRRGGSGGERSVVAWTRMGPDRDPVCRSSPVFPTCSGTGRSARSRGRCCARRTGRAFAASRIFSISSRSENRTGAPVAKTVNCRARLRAIGLRPGRAAA